MLAYFHSKEQLGLTHMECGWYGLTQDSDGSLGQAIIFALVRSIILLPISESFHSMLVHLKMHGLLLWDKPTTWYTHFA